MLVCLDKAESRRVILQKTRKLKDAGEPYSRIYVKKDLHAAVRREWKRLREAKKTEAEKPENEHCNITLDTERRVLLRDGIIIDRWSPTFFQ